MPVIFFSATLSPYEYYRNVLVGKDADYCRSIELASPFPPENLEILIDTSISTVYKERALNTDRTAKRICDEIINRRGNYMVFFPSFEFMNNVCSRVQKIFDENTKLDNMERKLILQRPNMTKEKSVNFNLIEIRTTLGIMLGIMLGLTLGLGNKAPLQTLVYQSLAIPTLGC